MQPPSKENFTSSEWSLDADALKDIFNDKTKAIIINNPNNPLGKVFSRPELEQICALCKKHDVLIISDDVYEHITYDETPLARVVSLPGMW